MKHPARTNKLFHLLVVMGASMTGALADVACSGGGGVDSDAARDAAADSDYGKISPSCGKISDYGKISPDVPDSGAKVDGDAGGGEHDAHDDGEAG